MYIQPGLHILSKFALMSPLCLTVYINLKPFVILTHTECIFFYLCRQNWLGFSNSNGITRYGVSHICERLNSRSRFWPSNYWNPLNERRYHGLWLISSWPCLWWQSAYFNDPKWEGILVAVSSRNASSACFPAACFIRNLMKWDRHR